MALHPPVKDVGDNQADGEIKIQEEVSTQEPTPSQPAAEVVIGEIQREDAFT